ncbi:YlmC/YmxH family sporulation protein [Terrisporobacter sp.]
MIRVSDIMDKEIINVKNGKKMGFITDIDIDVNEGKVISFSTTGEGSGGFFSRGVDIDVVFWNDILKIGCDTIIVNIGSDKKLDINEIKL